MTDELLDRVDKDDNVIGTVWKSEAHQNIDIIHREVAVVVFNNQNQVLLQQRSLSKLKSPGVWQVSAAGHVGAGENPDITVKRELMEEVSLELNPIFFEKRFFSDNESESRFVWIYYALVNGTPETKIDVEEVEKVSWYNLNDLKETIDGQSFSKLSHLIVNEVAKFLKI